jgi:hypothetical protein
VFAALFIAPVSIVLALEPEAVDVDRLIRELGDAKVETREAASLALEQVDIEIVRSLEPRLNDASLTPEQRIRLESAVRERFLRSQRGALGVQFDQQAVPTGGMRVAKVYPNFPAAGVLMPGDVIVQVEQTKIGASEPFYRSPLRPYIISREPGEKIKLVIDRNGQRLDVEPALGKFADFPGERNMMPTQVSREDLLSAWAVRRARMGASSTPALDAGLSANDWMPRGRTAVEADVMRRGEIQGVPIGAGGRPAVVVNPDDVMQYDKQVRLKGDGMFVIRGGGVQIFQQGGGILDARTAATERKLLLEMTKLEAMMQEALLKAENATLSKEEREKAKNLADYYEKQVNEVRSRIIMLREPARK